MTRSPLSTAATESADWIDVVKFFSFNYALHAFTVLPLPGANIFEATVTSLCALLIPWSGAERAFFVLNQLVFLWGDGELGKARSAGALCTLVPAGCALDSGRSAHRVSPVETTLEDAWEPLQSYAPTGFDVTDLEQVNPLTTVVHGQYPADIRRLYTELPGQEEQRMRAEKGAAGLEYTLVAVPPLFSTAPLLATNIKQASPLRRLWDKVRGRQRQRESGGPLPVPLALSCKYSLLKTSVALIKILYGCYELYTVNDDHIQRYGYVAYQFTVIPYVGMSILNLLAGLSAPS